MKSSTVAATTTSVLLGLFLLVTSTFYPLSFLSVFDAKRVLELIVLFALLVFAIAYSPLRHIVLILMGRVPKVVCYAMIGFLGIGIVSSLRLPHPGYALLDISMIFVLSLLVFVVAGSRNLSSTTFDKWAIALITIMGFGVAFQESMGYLAGWLTGIEFSYDIALVHFAHPRFYNQLQTLTIPLLAGLPIMFPKFRWIRVICIALLGLQWFLVFSTGARGTSLSLFTAMVIVAFWLPKSPRLWIGFQISGVLTGILIFLSVNFLNNTIISKPDSFYSQSVGRPMMHTSGRSKLWKFSLEDAIQNPILGTGPTRYACGITSWVPAHPHSFPFRILGEWGFISFGFALILIIRIGIGFLISIKRLSFRLRNDERSTAITDPNLLPLLSISVIAGTLHACLSGLLIMPTSQIAMVLIAGWALSLTGNSRSEQRGLLISKIVLVGGLLVATTQLIFTLSEIAKFPERMGRSVESVRLAPRFWWVGKACDYEYTKADM